MDKKSVRMRLKDELETALTDLRSEIAAVHDGVDIDEGDTLDPEDYSHQSESSSLELNLIQRVNGIERQLEIAGGLSTEDMTTIGPGALVITSNHYLYISVAAHPFTIDKHLIVPISVDSPIYPKIKSNAVGDTILMGESEEKIIAIN